MRALSDNPIRVLSIDPTTAGFGFAVMEGADSLIDWGVKEATDDKNPACLKLVAGLMNRYQPVVVVVKNPIGRKSRRCERVRELIRNILNLAVERGIRTRMYSRMEVKSAFAHQGARTKHEIATAISKNLLELGPRVPRYRHPWMSEDYRMAIFNAVALALTFYKLKNKGRKDTLSALGINDHVEEQENSRSSD